MDGFCKVTFKLPDFCQSVLGTYMKIISINKNTKLFNTFKIHHIQLLFHFRMQTVIFINHKFIPNDFTVIIIKSIIVISCCSIACLNG